jgi:glucose/arabinose dehydrogenase
MRVRAAILTVVVLLVTATASPAHAVSGPTPMRAPASVTVDGRVASGLDTPWGLAFLPDGSALVGERDTAIIRRIPAKGGRARPVGTVRHVAPFGEGGLLGLAVPSGPDPRFLFAYITTATDNRVVRIAWDGRRTGAQRAILTGIPRSDHHDGGRLLIGPGNTLFVSTGDAGVAANAQDRRSLAGKVLHITYDGRPAPGNPFPGSPVYTLGHRNVQGLAFDRRGRVWASEFGEKDVDELNLLRPGGNYGWPVHEGAAADPRYVNPFAQWSPTATASPSGIAIVDNVAYVASLRGQTLYAVPLTGPRAGRPARVDVGDRGRLRTVALAPDGSLWLVTGHTDGRGTPRPGDDQILRLTVS